MRKSRSISPSPKVRKSKHQEPVLTKRLSKNPNPAKGESPRYSFAKQPSPRPSFANTRHESLRDLLPVQNTSASPQWQGRAKRQTPPPPPSRASPRSPPLPAVVTSPDSSAKKESRKSRSSERPKTRKAHRPSTSEQKRSSQIEVNGVEQRDMHPVIQEHILAELQIAQQTQQEQEIHNSNLPQHASRLKKKPDKHGRPSRVSTSNGPKPEILHPYLQEHILAERAIRESSQATGQQGQSFHGSNSGVDEQFAAFAGVLLDGLESDPQNRDHQQVREDRQRRHREKKKNRKKGWFGRKSGHSRTRSADRSPDTNSMSSVESGFEAPQSGGTPPPPVSSSEPTPKSIGSRLRNSLILRRAKHKDNNKNYNPEDAPNHINDPLLQQSIMESIRNMNVDNPSISPSAQPRSRSAPRPRGEAHAASRDRRHHSPAHMAESQQQRQRQQQAIKRGTSQRKIRTRNAANGDGVVQQQQQRQPGTPEPQHDERKHRRTSSLPGDINRDEQVPSNQQSAINNSELDEIAMMFVSNTATTESNDNSQKPNQSAGITQQFLLEQQAALEALQRQREGTKKAPPTTPPAPDSSPPPQMPPVHHKPVAETNPIHSTTHLGLHQMSRSDVPNTNAPPPVENGSNEMGTPPAGALHDRPGKGEIDYCGQSYDGSRSTVSGEDDFFDWGSDNDPPPIREAVTRYSFVSDITMPRGIGSDNEYYSESEEEDFYAENYDSDDYVDDDEWERLEKAMEKGGPEAERQWEEFLKKQSQQEASVRGPPANQIPEVQGQSRPFDGGYAPTQMVDPDDEKAPAPIAQSSPPPPVAQTPSPSMNSVRTTFVCECCAERKSARDHGHRCDDWDTPHMVCSGCIRTYLETPNAKFRMVESSNNQTIYQVKCFTALDGTSCHDCNAKISFDLKQVFPLADLERWLVRQRNRLHTMKNARNY